MLGTTRSLGLIWVAGEMTGRVEVGSNFGTENRWENLASWGSSGKRSLIRFSRFVIWLSSPNLDSYSCKKENKAFARGMDSGF